MYSHFDGQFDNKYPSIKTIHCRNNINSNTCSPLRIAEIGLKSMGWGQTNLV